MKRLVYLLLILVVMTGIQSVRSNLLSNLEKAMRKMTNKAKPKKLLRFEIPPDFASSSGEKNQKIVLQPIQKLANEGVKVSSDDDDESMMRDMNVTVRAIGKADGSIGVSVDVSGGG